MEGMNIKIALKTSIGEKCTTFKDWEITGVYFVGNLTKKFKEMFFLAEAEKRLAHHDTYEAGARSWSAQLAWLCPRYRTHLVCLNRTKTPKMTIGNFLQDGYVFDFLFDLEQLWRPEEFTGPGQETSPMVILVRTKQVTYEMWTCELERRWAYWLF